MTKESEIALIKQMDDSLLAVLKSKGNDYATEDVLSNFKRLATASKALNINTQTPVGYALFMTLMKLDRISNLLSSNKTPSNESVDDSFGDGVNYLKLAWLCYKEGTDEIIPSE